jgi:hypothetical protein
MPVRQLAAPRMRAVSQHQRFDRVRKSFQVGRAARVQNVLCNTP